ncbi:hypothetical protein B0T24DRAFT_22933 [Lasiosphaeria ovina]|uniref:Uncharacterized protein n=1 Tax=Lasiosphaeria ovina TaxID=92902 RepID=A0AAE0TX40_9PEZI|nr:hypothetical protein B0T24DRAFT_22933 [Lasiosphaeria ovina]
MMSHRALSQSARGPSYLVAGVTAMKTQARTLSQLTMGFDEIAQWKERNRKQQEQEGPEKKDQQRPTVFDLKVTTPQHKSNVWNISYAPHDDTNSELPTAAAANAQQHQVLLASFHRRAHAGPSSLLAASTSAATDPNKFSQSPSNSAVFYTTSANTLAKTAPQTTPQPGGSGSNGSFTSSSSSNQRSAAEITDVPSLAVLSKLCRRPASASHLDKNNNIDEDNTVTVTNEEEKFSRQLKTLNCGIGGASTLSSVLQRINQQLASWSGRSGFNPSSSSDSVPSSSSSRQQQPSTDEQASGNNHIKNKNDKTNNNEAAGNQSSGSGSGKNPKNPKDNNNNSDKPWPNDAPLPILRQLPMFLGGGPF